VGSSSLFSDAVLGGAWSSSDIGIATVDLVGNVTGVAAGSAVITYSLGTGCFAVKAVDILTLPPSIIGSANVCVGSVKVLTDAATGGVWTSGTTSVATVATVSGVADTGKVTGVAAGTSVVTYSLGAGCIATATVTVDPVPLPITGTPQLCEGMTTTLSDATFGGTWSSGSTHVATVDPVLGVVSGDTAGTAVIAYTLGTGCGADVAVTVYPVPTALTGNRTVCMGETTTLAESVTGGTWSSITTAVATVGSLTGIVTGDALGTSDIVYSIGPGCAAQATVTVVALPDAYGVTGGGSYCAGGAGVAVGLDSSDGGTNYLLYRGYTATGAFPGTGFPIGFGLQTVAGVYTVVAINTTTGCTKTMRGSVTIIVTPTVLPAVGITASGRDTVCSGTSVTYTAVPANGGLTPTYEWNINGVNVAVGATYTYIPANGDVVKVTLTSDALCALPDTASHSVTADVLGLETPSVGFSSNPGDTVCDGIAVSFHALPVYGGPSPSYSWLMDGSVIGSGAVFSYIPTNGDTVWCFMTSDFPCLVVDTASSNKVVMTVDSPIIPTVTISANPGTSVGVGGTVTLTANVVNGGATPAYQWFVNSLPIAGATTMTYVKGNNFDTSFEDSVSVEVTSSGICPMGTHNWVYIEVSDVGVNNVASGFGAFTVLPNPSKGTFTVKGNLGTANDGEITIEITDLLGQSVYQNRVMAPGGKVNERITLGNGIANGMYILNLHTETENEVFHIVVEQ
jgi:hypothetical protein